jgi:hypothetical protein
MNPFQVICLNDQHRPAEFPSSKWIKKGEPYTVINVLNLRIQGGQGFVLEEIDMTGCDPYRCFAAWRFAVPVEAKDIEEVLEEELTA